MLSLHIKGYAKDSYTAGCDFLEVYNEWASNNYLYKLFTNTSVGACILKHPAMDYAFDGRVYHIVILKSHINYNAIEKFCIEHHKVMYEYHAYDESELTSRTTKHVNTKHAMSSKRLALDELLALSDISNDITKAILFNLS